MGTEIKLPGGPRKQRKHVGPEELEDVGDPPRAAKEEADSDSRGDAKGRAGPAHELSLEVDSP